MKFNYQARTKEGEIQMGVIEAASKEAAATFLQKQKLFVTLLESVEAAPFFAKRIKFFEKVTRKEVMIFSRQLSIMFQSKVALVEALQVLSAQAENRTFREKIATMIEDLEGGATFSQALSRHAETFPSFYVNIVKAGEISGTLSKSLEFLADYLERQHEISQKLMGAMLYPILLVLTTVVIIFVIMLFVLPQLTSVLEETVGVEKLPFLTRVLIAIPKFLFKWGLFLIIGLGAMAFLALRYLKSPEGKKGTDKYLLKLPVIGSFLKKIYLVRFADNLSTLVFSGLPIAKALEVSADVVDNHIYKSIILKTAEGVKRGETISLNLAKYPEFIPPLVNQMILVGEKTGSIEKTLKFVVEFYEKEVDRSVSSLLEVIQPILIVVLGLAVAGIIAAVLLPLYGAITTM